MRYPTTPLLAVVLVLSTIPVYAGGGTALTYQGRLLDAGEPANGLFNVEFGLWDADAGGIQIGATVSFKSLPIADGLFTVELDFGANAFDNTDRWLEISVDGVPLVPRQPITRSPYSIQTRGIFVDQDQRVFVGRDSPITSSEVFGIHSDTSSFGGMYVSTSSELGLPFYGYSAGGDVDAYHYYQGNTGSWHLVNGGGIRLTVQSDGNVGIGTTVPEYALHVESDGLRTISAVDTSNSGATFGVWSESSNTNGTGVRGFASANSGGTWGVRGRANSSGGTGVRGWVSSFNGINYGVWGQSDSDDGYDFFAAGAGQNYGSASSIRWKSNVRNIEQPLEMVAQLRGVYFDWDKDHGGHHDVGMIAEEVGQVLPEIVNYEENGIDAIGMDYSKLTPLLVEAVNALRAENDVLRTRLDSLENLVERLNKTNMEKTK